MEQTSKEATNQAVKSKPHTLTIAGKITITGVESVVTLNEKEVTVSLGDNMLLLTGSGFCPLHLSVEEGTLVLSGSVGCARYAHTADKQSLWKRLTR